MLRLLMIAGGGTVAVIAGLIGLVTGNDNDTWSPGDAPPDIAFIDTGDRLPSLAEVEARYPLAMEERRFDAAALAALDDEERAQLYARLTAGPLPHGLWRVAPLLAEGETAAARLGGRLTPIGPPDPEALQRYEALGRALLGRRVFEQGIAVTALADDRVAVIEDLYGPPETRAVAREGLFGRFLPAVRTDVAFAAPFGCGASLLDPRRDAIVIDRRAAGAGRSGQRPSGLRLREEYRLVRPGLYLGRVYADGQPLFDVAMSALETVEAEAAFAEACRTGGSR